MKSISVVIPTWRRVETLKLSLRALARQTLRPSEVICGVRCDDDETRKFLDENHDWPWPLMIADVQQPGVIASMQAAVDCSQGDIVCLFDDDAEPLLDWLRLAANAFENDSQLGVIGGRDLLQDHPEMRRRERTTFRVGKMTWYGRSYGNHHRGHGPPRNVDILKGCNIAVRGDLLRNIGFERALRGQGAQVHWEMALCFDLKNRGNRVVYDPALQVIHHIAPRHDNDSIHRGKFNESGFYDMVYNEAYIERSRRVPHRRARYLWNYLVGSSTCPGFVRAAISRGVSFAATLERQSIAQKARCDAKQRLS